MDFGFASATGKMTFIGKFVRGDEEIFEAVLFAGFNGILTGIRKDGFSISLNTRKPSCVSNYIYLAQNIINLLLGKQ